MAPPWQLLPRVATCWLPQLYPSCMQQRMEQPAFVARLEAEHLGSHIPLLSGKAKGTG